MQIVMSSPTNARIERVMRDYVAAMRFRAVLKINKRQSRSRENCGKGVSFADSLAGIYKNSIRGFQQF